MGEAAQLITALATLLTAFAGLIIGIRNTRKIEQVRHATNSLTDRLVETTAVSSEARGNLAGRAELKAEQGG